MALLRRILTSSAHIRFRLLSSSASPRGGAFRDAPHISKGGWLPRTVSAQGGGLSPRRLLTSSSNPSSSQANPEVLVGFLKSVFRVKVLGSVLGFVCAGLFTYEGYCIYLACRGDAPNPDMEASVWIPSNNINVKALLDTDRTGLFYLVVGNPGIGKTTQLCAAARDREAAIYINGAQRPFKDLQETINQRYGGLRLNFLSWIRPQRVSALQTLSNLSTWVKLFSQKRLVFIVDHIEKLDQEDVLKLVSWAKTQADERKVLVILVGSDQNTKLISNSDFRTRGRLVWCYPPSAQETREALRKFISTHSDEYKLDVEECLYLRGTCPTEYLYANLDVTEEQLMLEFLEKHSRFELNGRGFKDGDFWFRLLVAGSNGVSLVEDDACEEGSYYVPDKDKVLSEPCILQYKRKVYFVSGRSREMHANLLLSAYKREVDKSSAEVERLSGVWSVFFNSGILAKEKEKLVKAKERIAKIKECMSNKSYEAYGPLYHTEGYNVKHGAI